MKKSQPSSDKLVSLGQRLREERERLGFSQTALAEFGGIQKLAQFNYEKGARDPSAGYLYGLKQAGVDIAYVLTGERAETSLPSTSVSIPLYDVTAAAGSGCEVLDEAIAARWNITEDVARHFRLHGNNLGGVQVKGDSMEPTLKDAGWVIFDGSDCDVERSGIFVVRCGNELRVKRIQPLVSGGIKLKSDNPLYDSEIVEPEDDADFEIVGRVLLHMGEMK